MAFFSINVNVFRLAVKNKEKLKLKLNLGLFFSISRIRSIVINIKLHIIKGELKVIKSWKTMIVSLVIFEEFKTNFSVSHSVSFKAEEVSLHILASYWVLGLRKFFHRYTWLICTAFQAGFCILIFSYITISLKACRTGCIEYWLTRNP